MSHWLLDSLSNLRTDCHTLAARIQIESELGQVSDAYDWGLLRRGAESMDLAVVDIIASRPFDWEGQDVDDLRTAASEAFRFQKYLPFTSDVVGARRILRAACMAVLGERGADAARWLNAIEWPGADLHSEDWRIRTWSSIADIWLRLIRKNGWEDRDAVLARISELRSAQAAFEVQHLERIPTDNKQSSALELIGLYHLAKAAEIFAQFLTDGRVEGRFQIQQMLDIHFDRVFAVNCKSVYLAARALVPQMKAAGAGAILNIASTAGVSPRPNLNWYNASKGWVNTATRTMAVELAPHGIRVNAVNPVAGETPLLKRFMGQDTPEKRAAFKASIPMGRLSTAQDIAGAAVYLCSDDAALVTGVCMEVDGGRCI